MDKLMRQAFRTVLLCICMSTSLLVTAHDVVVEKEVFFHNNTADNLSVKQRINNMYSVVELRYTPDIEKRIKLYTGRGKQETEKLLARYSRYSTTIENTLYAKNLPDILKYIPVIESELKPHARSRSGAVGMWQFMKTTGKSYGLEVNNTIDERMDPSKSTEAALNYLQDLHERFGDWTLAIAAYNCGPGNVRKAIRKSGSNDFWKLKKFLPKETRNYIPKLIAANYVMQYYHMHDIVPDYSELKHYNTSSTLVQQKLNLIEIAESLQIEVEELKEMNRHLKRNYIPKNQKGYSLYLPSHYLNSFYAFYQPHLLPKKENKVVIKEAIAIEEKILKKAVLTIPEEITGLELTAIESQSRR